jgi:hypothetical protein
LSNPLPVEIFDPKDPITIGEPGGQLVEHIVSHTGDAIMEAGNLTTGFFAVF